MQLGFYMGYAAPGTSLRELVDLAIEAERLGYESAWAAEAWGSDAVTPLAWLGALTERIDLGTAVMQLPGRSPANAAMTAATLDLLSGGRVRIGLGTSGPQVVEGWHGEAWGRPLGKLREYVEIVRAALRREVVEHHGAHYDIPYTGDGATGLGKPLKLMLRPQRKEIPIYLATLGPKAVELTFEVADGWLPVWLSPTKAREVFPLQTARDGFDVAAGVQVVVTDDVQAGLDALKPHYGFYIGGMGAKGTNFYNDLFARFGFEAEAPLVQEAFLAGNQRDAFALVPDAFVDDVALVGPPERIRDKLAAWRESGVTTLLVQSHDPVALRTMAELVL
jgi:F420-dependent oxidoreductase-like protein